MYRSYQVNISSTYHSIIIWESECNPLIRGLHLEKDGRRAIAVGLRQRNPRDHGLAVFYVAASRGSIAALGLPAFIDADSEPSVGKCGYRWSYLRQIWPSLKNEV